jgi:hypothetical protein
VAQRNPRIEFEDIPLAEARGMTRGLRMNPELYHTLREKITSLRATAARMTLPDGTNPTTMKNQITRVGADVGIPVTIRRVSGGLLFWRSTQEISNKRTRSSYRSSLLGSHKIRRGAPDDGGDNTKHHDPTTGDLGR